MQKEIKPLRVIIAGGGTAGHINAGIAIFDELKKDNPKTKLLFVGTKRGMEKILITKAGYDINFISSRGLNRQSLFVFLYSLLLVPISIIQSISILLRFKPNIVIGVGGYASGPFVLSAKLFRLPVFLLEQNAVMGFTNKLLIRFAKKVFSAFPLEGVCEAYRKKISLVGNPVRKNIVKINNKEDDNKDKNKSTDEGNNETASDKSKSSKVFTVFIFGGSQGARAINQTVVSAINLLNSIKGIRIIHQTGKLDFENVKLAYNEAVFEHQVSDYIYDIEKIYAQSDIVICRAGASTIFELIASCNPSILIPLPTAANNHQLYNARFLSRTGCAELIEQKDFNPQKFYDRVLHYTQNRLDLNSMRLALTDLSAKTIKNSAELIVKEIKANV
jgi:UDP-N-acetylglucosamine--N-acetylmuramyl-(pentapeptide) pyrophosphoryl-undecaprenol N-acetylglucosamine transferase